MKRSILFFICGVTVATVKGPSVERHFATRHESYVLTTHLEALCGQKRSISQGTLDKQQCFVCDGTTIVSCVQKLGKLTFKSCKSFSCIKKVLLKKLVAVSPAIIS